MFLGRNNDEGMSAIIRVINISRNGQKICRENKTCHVGEVGFQRDMRWNGW
jgi:hypothetical protein